MIYSIGHGNRSWTQFLSILNEHNGKYLVDVRSVPRSKFNPDFDKDNLEVACKVAGIRYLFWGDSLGGKPKKKSLYDQDGRADYIRMSEEEEYNSSISRLRKAASLDENTFIMCSELCPSQCHRSKLIGKTLEDFGVHPIHIDKNGYSISQREVISLITRGQDDLFGESPSLSRSKGKYV